MSVVSAAGRMMREYGLSGLSLAAITLFLIHLLSLPPKWATLHISGLLLVLSILYARRDTWRSEAVRAYLVTTCAWLIPFMLVTAWQNAIGLDTATTWPELARLVLRVLGVGMGVLVLMHRGWLTLRAATIVVLCVLAVNIVAGYAEWMLSGAELQDGWRAFRMTGMVFNPNPFGTFMALCIVLTAGLLRGRAHNKYLWLMLVSAVPAVWASGSRGAILALLAGLAVLFLPRNRKGLMIFLVSISVLSAAVVLYTFSDYKYSRGDVLRSQAAIFTVEKVLEAPLHGWGKKAFSTLPGKPDVNAPHNMLLDLALAGGLLVFLGWLWGLAWLSIALVRKGGELGRVVLALLAAAVVAGTLEYSLLNSTHFRGLWVLVMAFSCWVLALPGNGRIAGENSMSATHRT